MIEDEIKLAVHGPFGLPDLVGNGVAAVEPAGTRTLRATYWDTADLRLARNGVTLRHRTGEDGPPWQLKLPVPGSPGVREELAEPGDPREVPAALRALVTGWVRAGVLVPVATLRTDRSVYRVLGPAAEPAQPPETAEPAQPAGTTETAESAQPAETAQPAEPAQPAETAEAAATAQPAETAGETAGAAETAGEPEPAERPELAELVDDMVSVLDNRRVVARFRELEVERRAADDATMRWLRDRLVAAGAVEGTFTPKVVHALGPFATEQTDLPEPPKLTGAATAGSVVLYSLATGVRRLVGHDAPVRRGAPDAVHQMRVACRRLRSDLRTFRLLVDADWAAGLRDELRWLGGSLGAARDIEVLRERIAAAAQADPLAQPDPEAVARIDAMLAGREKTALAEVEAALGTDRYAALLERVVEAARHPVLTGAAGQPADQALTPLVGKAWRKLRRAATDLEPGDPDDDWHQVRIRAKRARYAAEAAAPALGSKAKRLGSAASSLQDLIGGHQDAVVAESTLLGIAAEHPGDTSLVLTCGRLAERERGDVRQVRAAFPAAWKKARQRRNTQWLRR